MPSVSLADDTFIKAVSAMPPEQQVQTVVAQLKQLNPAFDGRERHKVEAGTVTELLFSTVGVTDITALRALKGLKVLSVAPWVANQKGTLKDLSPLQGISLISLWCQNTSVADLAPLKGMPLAVLSCGGTQIKDLTPLRGMKLQVFSINDTLVNDLSPLEGMPLTVLWCHNTRVSDLSPLKTLPLQELKCDFSAGRDAATLRGIKTLVKINDTPAAAFWMRAGMAAGPLPPQAGDSQANQEPLYRVDFGQEGPVPNTFIVLGRIPTLGVVLNGTIDVPGRALVCRSGDGGAYIPRSTRAAQSIKDSFTIEIVFRITGIKNPPRTQCVFSWSSSLRIMLEHSDAYRVYAHTPHSDGSVPIVGGVPPLKTERWHTVRVTVDGRRKRRVLILDGKSGTTVQERGPFTNDALVFERIFLGGMGKDGRFANLSAGSFTGAIRSFAIWDQAQTDK